MFENVFEQLSLGYIQQPPEVITGGCSHLTYRVETDKDIYAVKVLNPKVLRFLGGIKLFKQRNILLEALINQGYPAVSAIYVDDNMAVYPWVAGQRVELKELHHKHLKQIASLVAKVHQYPIDKPLLFSPWQFLPETDWAALFANVALQKQLKIYETLYRQAWNSLNGNEVLSHGDLNYTNVLWDKDQPCVLDWESMGASYANAELISSAMAWSGYVSDEFNVQQYETMLQAYEGASGVDLILTEVDFYASWGYWLIWLVFCQQRVLGVLPCDSNQQAFYQKSVNKTLHLMQRLNAESFHKSIHTR